MDDTLKRLENKTDKILNELTEVKVDLAQHILRTSIAEERIEMIKSDVDPLKNDLLIREAHRLAQKELNEKRTRTAAFLLKALAVLVSIYALIRKLS